MYFDHLGLSLRQESAGAVLFGTEREENGQQAIKAHKASRSTKQVTYT